MSNNPAGPSVMAAFASRYLSGQGAAGRGRPLEGSQIFRPPSPGSPSHDPFVTSPSASHSHPHLPGSSRSPSPERTPPFPGPGIDAIPDIDNDGLGSGIGVGLLFAAPDNSVETTPAAARTRKKDKIPASRSKSTIPNPYAASSSESEEEADLDEVANVRRSLLRPQQPSTSAHRKEPVSERAKKGWLAHQSVFPASSSSSSEEETESEKSTEDESDDQRSRMMGRSRRKSRSKAQRHLEPDDDVLGYMPSPSDLFEATREQPGYETSALNDLEEPLLGPEELDDVGGERGSRPPIRLQVYHGRFGHWEREGLRKFKDSGFLALWLTSLLGVMIGLCFVWGSTDPPPDVPTRSTPSLIPLVPLLITLVVPALFLPLAFIYLLSKTVRHVLTITAISIPLSLFLCGFWTLAESFDTTGLDNVEANERWWGTTGLRLGSLFLWLLALVFARLVWKRWKRLERTVSVVELSTKLLQEYPPLLLLTLPSLAIFAIASIPFLTLIIRLGMVGYWRHPRENTWVYHIRPYAGWLIFLVTLIWVWTWGVIRGVGRVAVAGVIGEWFFHRDEPSRPPATEITLAAVHRATGTSLGSICLGAGIVATVRVVGRSAAEMKRITNPKSKILPTPLQFLTNLTPLFAIIAGVLDQLNGYALVYVGVTGEPFWPSARRAVSLAGRKKGGHLLDYTFVKLLLTLSSVAMGVFTGTIGYLYMTHSLSNPSYALPAGLLCGGVPFLAIRAGAAVLGDAADALFICYQIDRELGGTHCAEAKEAFGGEKPRGPAAV